MSSLWDTLVGQCSAPTGRSIHADDDDDVAVTSEYRGFRLFGKDPDQPEAPLITRMVSSGALSGDASSGPTHAGNS